ncbi:MAG: alpha/beta hydrolase [Candidatus Woesearchaeota archaeon]
MTKRVFMVHGWEGYPENHWFPWLKKELETKGFEVFVPAMPDTDHPKMGAWLEHLTKITRAPDKDCYFIGHSLGCITILRYLETLQENQKIGGVIFVAGFTSNLGYEELESFFTKPINWEEIESHCRKFVAIHSDNDPYVSLHYRDFFKEKLNAKIFTEHKKGHFSGSEGIKELPVVLDELLKMAK